MSLYAPKQTSLGLPEPVERVGAYALFWVSGLILLLVERNPTVRHHARQSVVVFGTLSVIGFLLWFVGGVLGWLPLIGGILAFPFTLLGTLDKTVAIILWIVLMVMAAVSPNFRLPGVDRVERVLR